MSLFTISTLLLYPFARPSFSHARTFTVANNCSYTIWPAIYTGSSGATPDQPTGWEAQPYTSVSFSVPDDWESGRIWGRRDCDFSNSSSGQTCLSGSCSGGLECTDPGATPASLAEWTLGAGSLDYYDVSLVDGYNLPMAITNNVNCSVASCPVDLDSICPSSLKGPTNTTSGTLLGCMSACDANLSGDSEDSPDCCTGSYSTAATCPPSGVEYYSFFKGNCPDAYAYAYDESSGTALWTCPSSEDADYTLTFCPSADSLNSTAPAPASGSSSVVPGSGSATSTAPTGTASTSPTVQTAPAMCSLKPPESAQYPLAYAALRRMGKALRSVL